MFSDWYYFSDSTRVEAARVDRDADQLDLKFHKSGVICRYEGAAHHYDGIISSGSPGSYVSNELKGWPYTKVEE